MFSKIQINKSTEKTSQQIEQIREKLNNADAVVIGAGAGLSTSAGFTYSGERFYKHFSDFAEKYGILLSWGYIAYLISLIFKKGKRRTKRNRKA